MSEWKSDLTGVPVFDIDRKAMEEFRAAHGDLAMIQEVLETVGVSASYSMGKFGGPEYRTEPFHRVMLHDVAEFDIARKGQEIPRLMNTWNSIGADSPTMEQSVSMIADKLLNRRAPDACLRANEGETLDVVLALSDDKCTPKLILNIR